MPIGAVAFGGKSYSSSAGWSSEAVDGTLSRHIRVMLMVRLEGQTRGIGGEAMTAIL